MLSDIPFGAVRELRTKNNQMHSVTLQPCVAAAPTDAGSSLRRARMWALRGAVAVALSAAATVAIAAADPAGATVRLICAGFTFAGDKAAQQTLYPHTSVVASGANGAALDIALREHLARHPQIAQHLTMMYGDANSDRLAVAMMMVEESVETQIIEGHYHLIVTLQANVLAFDQQSGMVVASYPVRHRYTSLSDTQPTDADVQGVVQNAFGSYDARENLIDQWLDATAKVRPRESIAKRLQVIDVRLAPEALRVIESFRHDTDATKEQIANALESSLAEHADVTLLPHAFGPTRDVEGGVVQNQTVGKMLLRFQGKEFPVKLPVPELGVSFEIRDFVSARVVKSDVLQEIFRVKGGVALDLVNERRYMTENVYETSFVTTPLSSNVKLVPWNQYEKALETLIDSLGKEMRQVDDPWLAEHASRNLEARKSFEQANNVIQQAAK